MMKTKETAPNSAIAPATANEPTNDPLEFTRYPVTIGASIPAKLPKRFWMAVSEPTAEAGAKSIGKEFTEAVVVRKEATLRVRNVTAIQICRVNTAAITIIVAA